MILKVNWFTWANKDDCENTAINGIDQIFIFGTNHHILDFGCEITKIPNYLKIRYFKFRVWAKNRIT